MRRLLGALGTGAAVTVTGYGLLSAPTWWTTGAIVAVVLFIATSP